MSSAIFVQWKNPLTAQVARPGGLRVSAALDNAAQNLATIRETCLTGLDEQLGELRELNKPGQSEPPEVARQEIYRISNEIYGLAGVFDLPELGQAAYSLCELVDRLAALGRWHQPSVDVHLAALHLLRSPEPGMDTAPLLERLNVLVERVEVISK